MPFLRMKNNFYVAPCVSELPPRRSTMSLPDAPFLKKKNYFQTHTHLAWTVFLPNPHFLPVHIAPMLHQVLHLMWLRGEADITAFQNPLKIRKKNY
jgi:hypothetical protein